MMSSLILVKKYVSLVSSNLANSQYDIKGNTIEIYGEQKQWSSFGLNHYKTRASYKICGKAFQTDVIPFSC